MTAVDPKISVVMAVKNGGLLVREAVDSILNQSFSDFELIIINDGSTDSTLEVLNSYEDTRIRIFSQENKGLSRSLNRGIELSRGEFIARQDHDDLSLPTRLEKQLQYMLQNQHCGLLGTCAEIWSMKGSTGRVHDHPTSPGELAFDLIFNNPFVHTSWMLRKKVLDKVGYYAIDPAREPPEDYELASRIARSYDVANLPERLVIYREVDNSLSSQIRPTHGNVKNTFAAKLALISGENLSFACGFDDLTKNAINFGALTHSFYAGIVGKPDLKSMQNMLSFAASKLEDRYPGLELKFQLAKRQENIRHQFYLHFESRSFLKKVYSRFFQKMKRVLWRLRAKV